MINGGRNPTALLNPNRPQVDFSGAKTDYRSEMMRRDLEGKLDGDGIKAGQAIEMGVTIAAPLVIGGTVTPKAAPQSLRSLGALENTEVSAAQITLELKGLLKTTKMSQSNRFQEFPNSFQERFSFTIYRLLLSSFTFDATLLILHIIILANSD